MRYAVIYYLLLPILFFSTSYATDDTFIPQIKQNVGNTNTMSNAMSNNGVLLLNVQNYRPDGQMTSENNEVKEIKFKEDERINNLVQVAFNHCINRLGAGDHKKNGYNYSCENLILVWTAENGGWHRDRVSPTSDYGLCQLHYKRHKNFIDSEEFKDPINQIEYCQEVWEDAYKKGRMPWVAYSKKDKMKERFIISQ